MIESRSYLLFSPGRPTCACWFRTAARARRFCCCCTPTDCSCVATTVPPPCPLHSSPPTPSKHHTARSRWASAIQRVIASNRAAAAGQGAAGALASAGGRRATLRAHILASQPAARSRHDLQIIDVLLQQCKQLSLLSRCVRGRPARPVNARLTRQMALVTSNPPPHQKNNHHTRRKPQGRAPRPRPPRAAANLCRRRGALPRRGAGGPPDRHHHGPGAGRGGRGLAWRSDRVGI